MQIKGFYCKRYHFVNNSQKIGIGYKVNNFLDKNNLRELSYENNSWIINSLIVDKETESLTIYYDLKNINETEGVYRLPDFIPQIKCDKVYFRQAIIEGYQMSLCFRCDWKD